MEIHSSLRLLTAGTHLLSNSNDFIKSVIGFQPFKSWLQKIHPEMGQCLKLRPRSQRKTSFGTSTSWDVFSEVSSSVILLTVYESYVLKTGVPILWMSLQQKRCPQGKLVSNSCFALSSHADSLSEGYIPVSMPSAIFTVFSLLM